jgi:hypothetical protein
MCHGLSFVCTQKRSELADMVLTIFLSCIIAYDNDVRDIEA